MKNLNIKIILLIVFTLVNTFELQAQKRQPSTSLIFNVGTTNLMGDLGGGRNSASHFMGYQDIDFLSTRQALNIAYRYKFAGQKMNFLQYFSLKQNIGYNRYYANDMYSTFNERKDRNLSVFGNIYSTSFDLDYYFIPERARPRYAFSSLKGNRNISAYATIGVGVFHFEPKAKNKIGEIVKLRKLNTEGQGQDSYEYSFIEEGKTVVEIINPQNSYKSFAYLLKLGVEIKYDIDRQWAVGFEFTNNYTTTDYLDDVSGRYYDWGNNGGSNTQIEMSNKSNNTNIVSGTPRGNSKFNDAYFSVMFSLHYKLKSSNRKPRLDFGGNIPKEIEITKIDSIKKTDEANKTNSDSIHKEIDKNDIIEKVEDSKIDNISPVITINTPYILTENVFKPINKKQITVTGKVSDESGIYEVLINNQDVIFNEEGYFSKQINLKPGTNTINIIAKDIFNNTTIQKYTIKRDIEKLTSVDKDIPSSGQTYKNRFALIIGNEHYVENEGLQSNVDYAINDAKIFKEYSIKTLGIPEKNIIYIEDATLTKMTKTIDNFVNLMAISPKENEFFVYYAGHGYPAINKDAYIMPVDISAEYVEDGIKLSEFYKKLVSNNPKRVTVFIDACFSGGGRSAGLTATRSGILLKPNETTLNGNIVVFAASSEEEVSKPYNEKEHGLFTYFLLKSLQESNGNISYGELADKIIKEVRINSIIINKKEQTPKINVSNGVIDIWENWQLNE